MVAIGCISMILPLKMYYGAHDLDLTLDDHLRNKNRIYVKQLSVVVKLWKFHLNPSISFVQYRD